jgi:hypothetical protein
MCVRRVESLTAGRCLLLGEGGCGGAGRCLLALRLELLSGGSRHAASEHGVVGRLAVGGDAVGELQRHSHLCRRMDRRSQAGGNGLIAADGLQLSTDHDGLLTQGLGQRGVIQGEQCLCVQGGGDCGLVSAREREGGRAASEAGGQVRRLSTHIRSSVSFEVGARGRRIVLPRLSWIPQLPACPQRTLPSKPRSCFGILLPLCWRYCCTSEADQASGLPCVRVNDVEQKVPATSARRRLREKCPACMCALSSHTTTQWHTPPAWAEEARRNRKTCFWAETVGGG